MRPLACALALLLAASAQTHAQSAEGRSQRVLEAADEPVPSAEDPAPQEDEPEEAASAPLHLSASLLGDPQNRTLAAEVGASFSPISNLDLGAVAVLGSAVGARLTVALHPARPWGAGMRPFVQLRGIFHPVSGGFGAGAGAMLGASLEAGPGRLMAGAMGELYAGPASHVPYALLLGLGYELDLLRPGPKPLPPPPKVEPPPVRSVAATLRGRVIDLEDKPLQAQIIIPGPDGAGERVYDATPEYEIILAPGEYQVEAEAEGYLVRARRFELKAGETVVHDFLLRPIPAVKLAELTKERIEIKQRILFATNEAVILPASHAILDEVADIMLRNPAIKIRVEGHTDEVGTRDYNLDLSQRRARSVRTYLTEKGVPGERLTASGFGLTRPIADNKTEQGRAANRRVQFEITPE